MKEGVVSNDFNIIVDRIEGDFAVCEFPDMTMKDIKLSEIPFAVREKSTLVVRYTLSNELQFISIKKSKRNRRIPSKFIRFN